MSANSTINLTIAEYGEPYLWQLWLQQLAFNDLLIAAQREFIFLQVAFSPELRKYGFVIYM